MEDRRRRRRTRAGGGGEAELQHIPAKAVSNDVTFRKKGKTKKKGNREVGIKSQDWINKPESGPRHSHGTKT